MRCGEVCPTGALEPIPEDISVIAERVRMGVAEIDNSLCWARGGRGVCRACWYACPLADSAVVLRGPFLRPFIVDERCVGCGLCAEHCPPDAHAITMRPRT
jgi:Pyruvate/2-oxoacid:ferredoxin oxidoreductase delta subunit